jgi:Domain of unknown function (DUF4177)
MSRWEYQILELKAKVDKMFPITEQLEMQLNRQGDQEWELATINEIKIGSRTGYIAVFKRQVPVQEG